MRTIKFRAWDKLSKEMRNDAEYALATCLANPNDFELMQFTGLKSKSGKEIYEGDIIRVPYGKRFRLFEIAWDKEDRTPSFWGYCLTEPRKDESYRLGDHFEVLHEDGEIIGNIHENKP